MHAVRCRSHAFFQCYYTHKLVVVGYALSNETCTELLYCDRYATVYLVQEHNSIRYSKFSLDSYVSIGYTVYYVFSIQII